MVIHTLRFGKNDLAFTVVLDQETGFSDFFSW